jgi:hypothetical protein
MSATPPAHPLFLGLVTFTIYSDQYEAVLRSQLLSPYQIRIFTSVILFSVSYPCLSIQTYAHLHIRLRVWIGWPPLWYSGQSSWQQIQRSGFNSQSYHIFWELEVLEDRVYGLLVKSSWLQIQRSGFNSRSYQIFWELEGLEQGPLSLVSTIEELLGRKSSGFGLESREYGRRDPSRWPCGTLYSQKLVLTLPTSGGRSVGKVRSRTQTRNLFFL